MIRGPIRHLDPETFSWMVVHRHWRYVRRATRGGDQRARSRSDLDPPAI